jgi:molybdate transport system substrate-binding protein
VKPTAIWVLAAGAALAGCGGASSKRPLVVFAAASLSEPFARLEQDFEAAHPEIDVQCNFAGTPQLVVQLREGAVADLFASADEPNMAKVVADGKAAGTPHRFARNRLTIVVQQGNPLGIQGLADLARPGRKVALCGPEVPAGRYSREALAKAKVAVESVSDEPNVKALVAKVMLGELDAGIVYATDCRVGGVADVAIPDAHQVFVDYPIVACRAGANPTGAQAFVEHLLAPAGQATLRGFGFQSP